MGELIRTTRPELEAQRAALLDEVGMDYETLRDRAEAWQLRADELDIWHTIQGIDYLLDGEA